MKKILSLVLTLTIALNFVALVPLHSDTNAAKVYNLNDYGDFSSRTQSEVAEKYYAALKTKTTSYYSSTPSTKAPYSVGSLNEETSKSITNMLNFYRWLVGVSDVPTSVNSEELQAGALIRNFHFAHGVDISKKPSDMSDSLWNQGAECSHNILSMGYTPQGAITGYLNEGYNLSSSSWTTIGHRAMLLSYKTKTVDFGYVGSVGIGKRTVNSNASTSLPFVAFPAPGYVPDTMITSPNQTSWSVELNESILKIDEFSDITVTVKNLTQGTSYDCTDANGKLGLASGYQVTMLTFVQPSCSGSKYTDEYEVIINGVVEKSSGSAVTLKYSLEFFDPSSYTYTSISSVSVSGPSTYMFSEDFSASDIAAITTGSVDGTVNVTCENGRRFTLPVSGSWNVDSNGKKLYASVNLNNLPEYVNDSKGIASKVTVDYSQTYLGRISANNTDLNVGDSVNIDFTRYYTNTSSVELYRMDSKGNVVLVANQDSSMFNETDSYNGALFKCRFSLTNLKTTDSGTYYIKYKYDNSSSVYVVGPLEISVKDKTIQTPTPTSGTISTPTSASTPTPTSSITPGSIPTPVPTKTPELSVGDFVERCYKVALNRNYDTTGYKYWCSELSDGNACGAQVGYGFIFSDEYKKRNTTNEQYVIDLYNMFFGRSGNQIDEGGYSYWLGLLKSGVSREEVFAGFANSQEFYNLCNKYGVVSGYYAVGVPNNSQGGVNCFVARLYSICLDRLPDQAGQADWVIKLLNGTYSGSMVAYGFIFSPEFTGKNMSNEQYVAYLYRAFFGRDPDEEGFNYWVQELLNGQNKIFVFRGFVGSEEFSNLCDNYGIVRGDI